MPNRKHKRRLLWAFIILLLLFSGKLMIATIMPNDQPEQKQKNNPQPQKTEIKIAEAERVFQDVFCYCTTEDMIEAQRIASEHTLQIDSPIIETVGGQECLSGFYDQQKDIAYMSSIFSRDNFHDANGGDINGRADQYQLRDFYLKNGVVTFDLYTLDSPEYYGHPIIWRINGPELVNDVSDTNNYSDISGQPGYSFMRIDDRSLSWYWAAREQKNKKAIMVQRPSDDYSSSFEEYAEILGIDLSQFVFIDIK